MRILLVYPEFPVTFWSFKYALKFISKKAAYPPLGLLTVAAMLPGEWEQKLVDMNVSNLRDKDIQWADFVFISAMSAQSESAAAVIAKCKKSGVKTVAGGPLFTAWPEKFADVDHLVLGEAEITLPPFLADVAAGCAMHLYTTEDYPDIRQTPIPLWNLINMKKYSAMNIQYSRGCPFNCEFCDIIVLYGRKPRLKDTAQIIEELQSLHEAGWRGEVFFVDDNFIGNRQKLKEEVLPALISWSEANGRPFSFYTEASLNLADDEELMHMMVRAGFNMVFVGIETPNEASLSECNKVQNKNRDIMESVQKIQSAGMQVQGGFILGFDNDPASIFDTLIRFIQESGIVVAMVGLLNAPRGTKLFQRLKSEHRLTRDFSGNNTDYSMNFIPKMDYKKLMAGYKKVVDTIYAPECYYARIKSYLAKCAAAPRGKVGLTGVKAFLKSVFKLGIVGRERKCYWKLLFHMLFHNPSRFPAAVTLAIFGYHFRKVYRIQP